MSDEQRLKNMLATLRTADAHRGASPFTETRLRAAFRERHLSPARKRRAARWFWALPAAAAMLFALIFLRTPDAVTVTAPPAPTIAVAKPTADPSPAMLPVIAEAAPKVRRKATLHARRTPAVSAAAGSAVSPAATPVVATQGDEPFVMLPYAPPLHAREWNQVMRVRVPRQSLRSLGLPVNEERMAERVPADLLLGEDGVPRAIRVVNTAF